MKRLSEIEFRVALEQWHVDMAYAATCENAASRHLEFARRCADYRIAAVDIEQGQCGSPLGERSSYSAARRLRRN